MENKLFLIIFCGLMLLWSCSSTNIRNSQIVKLPIRSDPTISFRICFKAGFQYDPPGKEGLAYITARMLTEGATLKNSYEQIIEKLYPTAASYSCQVDAEMAVIYGRVHKDNLSQFYNLFIDAITRPAFEEDDLRRIKSSVLNYLKNSLKFANDEELGKAVLYTEIFAGTPYGHLKEGRINSVKSITIEDVKNFYKKYYTCKNVIIGVGGDFPSYLIENLKKDLSVLPTGEKIIPPEISPRPIKGLEVVIVEKNTSSTAISMGYPIDILRGSDEWYYLALANSWFGEHRNSSSHLYQVIREARGLNYGDYSYIEYFPEGGRRQFPPPNVARRKQIFEIWIRPVPNYARHFVLRATLRELQKLVDNGMTEKDFELTRNFLKKYILNYASTTMLKLGYAIDDKFYNISEGHLKKFRKLLESMTIEDVNKAVRKYLQYKNMKIVFVTPNAEKLKKELVENSPSPISYKTPKPDEIIKEDKVIANYNLDIKPENVKITKLEELFQ